MDADNVLAENSALTVEETLLSDPVEQSVKRPCLRDLRREETLARIEWMRAEAEESRERIS